MVDTVHPFGVGIHISTHKLRKVFCNGGTVAPCHFLQKVFAFNRQLQIEAINFCAGVCSLCRGCVLNCGKFLVSHDQLSFQIHFGI
nr:MAG TPA: hypothetical protein [Caudoviricetes sp.]